MEILKLKPVFKDYIWGGNRLRSEFGFESEYNIMAEGWMLAARDDGENTPIPRSEAETAELSFLCQSGDVFFRLNLCCCVQPPEFN